jgi:hypothetical protein
MCVIILWGFGELYVIGLVFRVFFQIILAITPFGFVGCICLEKMSESIIRWFDCRANGVFENK